MLCHKKLLKLELLTFTLSPGLVLQSLSLLSGLIKGDGSVFFQGEFEGQFDKRMIRNDGCVRP